MNQLVRTLPFHKAIQLPDYAVVLTPDRVGDAFHVFLRRDQKQMTFLVLRTIKGDVRVVNISIPDTAHIRRRVEIQRVPLDTSTFLKKVLSACLELAAVAFNKYAREYT
jgi:hypothetical protein